MKFIDLHCDTLMHLDNKNLHTLIKNGRCVDFERMKRGGCVAEFFAIYLPHPDQIKALGYSGDEAYVEEKFEIYSRDIKASGNIWGKSAVDIDLAENSGKVCGFLTLEDGRSVAGSHERLAAFFERGIRLITLTWNFENCFGFPNSTDRDAMMRGLTNFGKEAITQMNELGMIIDVSHLSDGGFWDIVKISKKPFVASHSNARTLVPHPRNLTDGMIRAISNSGGCVGLNFGHQFLNIDKKSLFSKIEDMVRHVLHIRNIGGVQVLALGSDLDGISSTLEIDSIDKMGLLFDALAAAGLSASELEALAYNNALRVISSQ